MFAAFFPSKHPRVAGYRRRGGSKERRLHPLDGCHVHLSQHPDVLSNSLALTNFMRHSLMKAAHASVGGAPCGKSGTMGRKRRGCPRERSPSQAFLLCGEMLWPRTRGLAHGVKALEEFVFGPCTPHGTPGQVRRRGTRPEPTTWLGVQIPPEPTGLICTGLKFRSSFGTNCRG